MLVVDDDPGSSGLLHDIFQQEGYDVTLTQRGEEALALAPARPFDVVLCDVQLPDMDGIELLRRLKRAVPTTAVIMVTAFGTYETAIKALHEGAFDYVRKPFTLQEVRLTVERAMERHPGLFVEANRGTIFLDEVSDMSLPMQAKLLRVLQERELKPVGGNETIPVDVRMVAATHQDLEELVRAGRFREDLYYRLN